MSTLVPAPKPDRLLVAVQASAFVPAVERTVAVVLAVVAAHSFAAAHSSEKELELALDLAFVPASVAANHFAVELASEVAMRSELAFVAAQHSAEQASPASAARSSRLCCEFEKAARRPFALAHSAEPAALAGQTAVARAVRPVAWASAATLESSCFRCSFKLLVFV